MKLLEYIRGCGAAGAADDGSAVGGTAGLETAVDPSDTVCVVGAGETKSMLVVHTRPDVSSLCVTIGSGGAFRLTEVFLGGGASGVCTVRQEADSRCEITSVAIGAAAADYTVDLDGAGAACILRGVFVAGGDETSRVGVRVGHNAAGCTSDSLVKGVAGGHASCEFRGLVYVAQDAQRTDARQTSRNIVLGDGARIATEPQLEIYADDVKCSHGATVGQLDEDAVWYMRQRGLSETQARRLQIEGFVRDVVSHAGALGDMLSEELTSKLESL